MDQIQTGMSLNGDWNELEMERVGRPGGDRGGWDDWKNTGGFTWKDKEDRKVTWMKDLDGQGGYFGNLLDNPLDDLYGLYGLLTLLMCQVGTS